LASLIALQGWPLIAVATVFGLIVGSFLNVVILRLPARIFHDWRAQSREFLELDTPPEETAAPPGIAIEPSHCPACKHKLSPLDNIPVLSWLALRGRCRYCGVPISAQYPLVELLTAVASAVVVWHFGATPQALAGLALSFTLIALAGIDVHTQLLPDSLTLPLLWLGLLLSLAPQPIFISPPAAIMAAAIGYLSLWSVYWLFKLFTGKEGMGHGDFKLLAALGAWMGPFALLPIVLLSSLVGALYGLSMLVLRRRERSTPMPFGPFLAGAGWLQFVFGQDLLQTYTSFFFAGT
jgi:leader peptidase (prepilin peptidase)/N-methyltransferase